MNEHRILSDPNLLSKQLLYFSFWLRQNNRNFCSKKASLHQFRQLRYPYDIDFQEEHTNEMERRRGKSHSMLKQCDRMKPLYQFVLKLAFSVALKPNSTAFLSPILPLTEFCGIFVHKTDISTKSCFVTNVLFVEIPFQ